MPEQVENKPYVVSGDIELLLTEWADRRGFTIPDRRYFEELRGTFAYKMESIFPIFEFVSEQEISAGLYRLAADAQNDRLTPVSMDGIYFKSQHRLGVSRGVDSKGNDVGLVPRMGFPPLAEQFDSLKSAGVKRIALLDDVVFSGGVVMETVDQLRRRGIEVPRIGAGIAVAEGMDMLASQGFELSVIKAFPGGVIDEVCERDFYPGVPFSGRTLGRDPRVGVPYIAPFGKPEQWASIPANEINSFSLFCLGQTERLFEDISRLSQKTVTCQDLDRKVQGMPKGKIDFAQALRVQQVIVTMHQILGK